MLEIVGDILLLLLRDKCIIIGINKYPKIIDITDFNCDGCLSPFLFIPRLREAIELDGCNGKWWIFEYLVVEEE